MTSQGALDRLRAALGDAVVDHEPVAVDGVSLSASLRPESGEALAAALRALSENDVAALICGGGTRLEQGNLLRRADVALETCALEGILELDAEDGVVHVAAGTEIAALREAVSGAGWELPLDPPGAAASVGGALAAAAVGPRFHQPRDIVLGLHVALASGARTRCGGRVVKNVTGYDLAKLYTGCFGSLGVIESAWLRLQPLPACQLALVAALPMDAPGCEIALAAARCASVRVAAHLDPALAAAVDPVTARHGPVLILELAGDEALLEADRARLAAELGAREVDSDVIERLRSIQAGSFEPGGLRFRLSALPSRMADVAARIRSDGGALLAYPARGLAYARFPVGLVGDERRVDVAVRSARLASQDGGGAFVIEAAPAWAKQGRDVFGEPGPLLSLFRALKRQYDPKGVLNPGRFAGCL